MSLSIEKANEILNVKTLVAMPSFVALYTFTACFLFNYTIDFIGVVFVGELVMLVAFPFFLFSGLPEVLGYRTLRNFLILSFVMLLGYVVSDVVAENTFQNMIRGWARVAFLLVDIMFFSVVMVKDRRSIWWGGLGFALSKLLFQESFDVELSDLKFRIGWVIVYAAVCLYHFLPRWLGSLILCGVGTGFLMEGARSLGGGAFLAGGLLLFIRDSYDNNARLSKVLLVGVLILSSLFVVHNYAKSGYEKTRKESMEGRIYGLTEGVKSVMRSPIIGSGSWQHLGRTNNMVNTKQLQIGGHSCILQSWVEGGILAALFFFAYFIYIIRGVKYIMSCRARDYVSAIALVFMIYEAWATVNSPFGGDKRVPIGFTVGLLTYFEYEKAKIEEYYNKLNRLLN